MRKASVELARLIACLLVIGVHLSLNTVVDGGYDVSRLFSACLVADGVAIFWLISGFFIFNTKSYFKLLKRTLKKIVVPMVLFLCFSFFMSGYLVDGKNILESITHSSRDYITLLQGIFSWNIVVACSGHLWYLLIYLLIILMFPVLKAYVNEINQDVQRQKIFLIVSAVLLVLNDLSSNTMAEFSHHSFNGAIPAAIFLVWGNIIFQHKDAIKNKLNFTRCMIIFLALNIIRLLLILNREGHNYSYWNLLYWYSIFGLCCATALIFACICLIDDNKKTKVNGMICWLSSYTFEIYIVHMLVINILEYHLISKKILKYIIKYIKWEAFGEYIYMLVMILFVFFISLCVIVIIKTIKNIFLRFFKSIIGCWGENE